MKRYLQQYNSIMRRILMGIFVLSFALISCQIAAPDPTITNSVIPNTTSFETSTPSLLPGSPTPWLTPTSLVTPLPTLTHTPVRATVTVSPTVAQPELFFEVRTHPDGELFVGDQVSFEVIAPPDMDLNDDVLSISNDLEGGLPLDAQFAPFGIGGRYQATLYWSWDTTELEAGAHPLSFSIQPLGYTWTQTVTLGTAAEIPPPEPLASWTTDESDCCIFYYVTDTAAAREITATLTMADQLADATVSTLEIDFTKPLVITLMPRVLGQGGFASNEMYISTLDRNYAGNSLEMVLHHEMVHLLDYRLGGEMRPTIFIEGLAVYLSGGHYKLEATIPRASALLSPLERGDGLGLGLYLPLRTLIDDFYNSQHEIGYIQAGALVDYMVETWGWEAYNAFYRDIHSIPNGTQSDALDMALQEHFKLTLDELEFDFLEMLRRQDISSEIVDDVRLTIEFFNTMRRYQQALDPSAYFLTAWLPSGPLMRENGIVADLVRRPSEIENIALETLLVWANQALKVGDHASAEDAIVAVNQVLTAIDIGQSDPFDVNTLATDHYEIAVFMQESGYQVEKIAVADGIAQVLASQGSTDLIRFEFAATNSSWMLVSSQ